MFSRRFSAGLVIVGLAVVLLALPCTAMAWNNFPRTDLGYSQGAYYNYPAYAYPGYMVYPAYPLYAMPYGTVPATRYQAAYPPEEEPVRVTVEVPATAEIFFNGHKTTQTGKVREFISPPLLPGSYTYEVRMQIKDHGQTVTQTRRVRVQPGDNVNVNFQAK